MRAGCDPETRKRISRLRLNRLSSGLALRGLVISFLPTLSATPPRGLFPVEYFLPFGKTADKSLLAVANTFNETAPTCAANDFASEDDKTVKGDLVTELDTAYLDAARPRQFVLLFTFLYLSGTRLECIRNVAPTHPLMLSRLMETRFSILRDNILFAS